MSLCWLNGKLIEAQDARIDPADRGFTLGDGVFETIAVRNAAARHLPRHLSRLAQGAAILGIACPWDNADIAAALRPVIAGADGSLRLTLTRGPSARGVLPDPAARPTLLITWSPPALAPVEVSAIICTATCRNEASPLARIKSLNYLDSVLARLQAQQAGADDAILLNTRGTVAEASTANLFALINGALVTPPVSDGALPGIARALLLERAGAIEGSLPPNALAAAECILLANSLCLRQVTRLRDHIYPAAPELRSRLADLVA